MGGSHRPRGITGGDTTRPAAGRQVGPVRVVGLDRQGAGETKQRGVEGENGAGGNR